jgi:two-component system response regulator VanR
VDWFNERREQAMRVLIAEDDALLAEAVQQGLRRESIAADIALDGLEALDLAERIDYSVVVLDRDLPRVSGDEVCRRLVASSNQARILMFTAARRIDEKVAGFELGADDYLAKPFEFPELVMRLRALDRRRAVAAPPVLEVGTVTLDPARREVYRSGRYVRTTRKEFAVLHELMRSAGTVVSAEELLDRAWDENIDPFTNTVRVTMSTLRKKLGPPAIIHTVAGVGYTMRETMP